MNADEFLGFYFPTVKSDDAGEAVAIGGDENNNSNFNMRRWRAGHTPEPLGRLYFCGSTVQVKSARQQRVSRTDKNLARTWLIGLDDIGTKVDPAIIPLQPTTKIETSPGNWQWFYKLKYPVPPAEAAALIAALARQGFTDRGATGAGRVFRLPGSLNTKYAEPFYARAPDEEHYDGEEWTPSELYLAFGVLPEGVAPPPEEVAPLQPGETDPDFETLERLGKILGPANARGFYPVECPQQHLHTTADQGSHYKPSAGGGVYKCLHGHCTALTAVDLRDWLFRLQVPDLEAFGQRLRGLAKASARGSAAGAGEGVRFKAASPGLERRAVRRELLENYIHVESENRYWSVATNGLVERAALDDRLKARMLAVGLLDGLTPAGKETIIAPHVWLRNQPDGTLRRVGKIIHRLGQPLITDNCLNIAPPIPARLTLEGEPEPWLELVDFICGDDDEADQVLDWCALVVTAWDEKPGWHLLIKGPPGVGKDLMLAPLVRYLAPRHWWGLTVKDIEGGFTPFLARRLIVLDELKMTTRGTISTHDIYNSVKAWTARGTQWVMVNEKNLRPYEALDLSAWGITSNAEVPLPIEDGDRRWDVIETPRQVRAKAYYNAIVDWLEREQGYAIAVSWLQRRWDSMSEARRAAVRGTAPVSQAKRELIINSAEGIDGAVKLAIEGTYGEAWPDLMRVEDVLERLQDSSLLSEQWRRALTTKRAAMALKAAGAVRLFGGEKIEDSAIRRTMRLWCLRAEKAKGYEKLGRGKILVDIYDAQRSGGRVSVSGNVHLLRPLPPR